MTEVLADSICGFHSVLGPHGRAFKKVFARAQKQLNTVFGMELVEMPAKDRSILSLDQKRKGTTGPTFQDLACVD